MQRTIIGRQQAPAVLTTVATNAGLRPPVAADSYQTQFLKLIPAEVISAYITIEGLLKGSILPEQYTDWYVGTLWTVFGLLAVLNVFYLHYVSKVKSRLQIGLSAGAFVVYVISLGGPFLYLGLPESVVHLFGSILIPIYTLICLISLNK